MAGAKLRGAAELKRRLTKLPGKVADKLVRKSLRVGAKPIKDLANALIPSQNPPFGGQVPNVRLKGTIKVVAGKRSRLEVLVATPKREKLGIPADAKFYYPAIVEYGYGSVQPRPYLRQAHQQKGPEAARLFGANLGPAIENEAKKRA